MSRLWPTVEERKASLAANRLMLPHERRAAEEKSLRIWTNLGLWLAVLLGFAVIIGHGGTYTAGIAAFGAALGVGGVLGFLFGVPGARASVTIGRAGSVAVGTGDQSTTRGGNVSGNPPDALTPAPGQPPPSLHTPSAGVASVSSAPPPTRESFDQRSAMLIAQSPTRKDDLPADSSSESSSDASSPPSERTSNLEQVADWVTKLLLGGGLTQMQRIPPKVWVWSRMVALGILRDNPQANEQLIVAQQAFAAGLLVYGFVLGFFAGFLITKLELGKAIAT